MMGRDGVRKVREFPWLQFDDESCLSKTDAPSLVVAQRPNAGSNISIGASSLRGILPSHVDDGSHPSTGQARQSSGEFPSYEFLVGSQEVSVETVRHLVS
jgi:hypothetical protein